VSAAAPAAHRFWPTDWWLHAADLVLLHDLLVQRIKDHFADDIKELASGAYDGWLQQPLSAVAGIILADQFAR